MSAVFCAKKGQPSVAFCLFALHARWYNILVANAVSQARKAQLVRVASCPGSRKTGWLFFVRTHVP